MAFLVDVGSPHVVESFNRKTRTIGLGSIEQYKDITEYRLTWPVDDSGGESPPATYSGATLTSSGPGPQYGAATGQYVAIYRDEGSWTNL